MARDPRTKTPKCLPLALVLLAAAGCGESSTGSLALGTAWVHGRVDVGGESMEGATVTVIADARSLRARVPAVVRGDGSFSLQLDPLVPTARFTVLVTSRRGETFGTEVARPRAPGPEGTGTFVHVNTVTTLVRAYLRAHPEADLPGARARIHAFLRIPPRFDLGDEIPAYRYARIHQPTFLRKARAYRGGLDAYLDRVVRAVGEGEYEYADYTNDESFELDDLPTMNVVSSGVQAATTTVDAQTEAAFTEAAEVGDSLVDPVVGILLDVLSDISTESRFSEVKQALTSIESDLQDIQSMISNLAAQVAAGFTETNYTTLASQLATPAIANIQNGLQAVQSIAQAAQLASGPNLTNLNGYVQYLNGTGSGGIGFDVGDLYGYAQTIHQYEVAGPSGSSSLMGLAAQLTGTDLLIGTPQYANYQNHVNYYASQQYDAAYVIAAMSAPVFVGTYPNYSDNFVATPAFAANQATNWIAWTQSPSVAIVDNVQQQLSMFPFPLLGGIGLFDPAHDYLWYPNSTTAAPAASWTGWVQSLELGGLTGFGVATTAQVQALFALARSLPGVGPSPASYSTALNGWGFTLQPGPVSIDTQINTFGSNWQNYGTQTFTQSGYLTVEVVTGDQAGFNFGWIDDHGNAGTIGSYVGTASLASVLGSSRDIFVGNQSNGSVYGGNVFGAALVVIAVGAPTFANQTPSFAFVPLGSYDGFAVQAGTATPDTLSAGTSFTQPLSATPTGTNGAQNFPPFPMTTDVWWTSSNPAVAPISNLVQPAVANPASTNLAPTATMAGAVAQAGQNTPPMANDGNLSTWWQGPPGQSLIANFGTSFIDQVRILLDPSWPAREQVLSISGSNDGVTWTPLVPPTLFAFAPGTMPGTNDNTVTIPIRSAQPYSFLAVACGRNSAGTGVGGQVAEIEIWGSNTPFPTPAVPNAAGTVHWLQASIGKSVTFTATRSLPGGNTVSGSITLQSPAQAGTAAPDSIQVWPTVFNVYAGQLQSPGVQLYVSRHLGNGTFQDVVQSGGPAVTFTSSSPLVSVNPQGLVTASGPVAAGTTVTITVTDPTVPAPTSSVPTRPVVTLTINVLAQ